MKKAPTRTMLTVLVGACVFYLRLKHCQQAVGCRLGVLFQFADVAQIEQNGVAVAHNERTMDAADDLLAVGDCWRNLHFDAKFLYGINTEAENNCKKGLMAIQNTLLDNQIDFDYADYDVLSRMTVCEDGTLLSPHGDRYAALILPPMEYTPAMANLLSDTAAWGNVIQITPDTDVRAAIEEVPDRLTRRALTADKATHGVLRLVRDTGKGRACLLVNTNEEPTTVSFTIAGMQSPVLYDPFADAEVDCMFTPDGDEFGFTVTLGALKSLIVKEK